MQPRSQGTEKLESLIERASAVFAAEGRISAAWVEGSIAQGLADAQSDVDSYVAVPDDQYDAVVAECHEIIARIAPVLGYGENPLPRGMLVFSNLEGLLRLDVVFCKESDVRSRYRPDGRVLFDKADVLAPNGLTRTQTNLRGLVETKLRTYLYGCFMPMRLLGRKEWGTLQLALSLGIFEYVVPAWLAVDDPANATRPLLHVERFLSPERRAQVSSYFAELHRTFAETTPHDAALKRLLESNLAMIFAALRAACERWDVPYPAGKELSILGTYRDELGLDVRPSGG